jgi:hypothetical protein
MHRKCEGEERLNFAEGGKNLSKPDALKIKEEKCCYADEDDFVRIDFYELDKSEDGTATAYEQSLTDLKIAALEVTIINHYLGWNNFNIILF